MFDFLTRKQQPQKVGYFLLESLWENDNAFFWRVTVFEKVPKWFGLSYDYKELNHIDCGDRDYAIKQITEMSSQYDVVEILMDTRI